MKQVYHKGKYRSGERSKHLSPFLKRTGNKRWRKDAVADIADGLGEERLEVSAKTVKKPRLIAVQMRIRVGKNLVHRYNCRYARHRDAEQAIRQERVIRASISGHEVKKRKP